MKPRRIHNHIVTQLANQNRVSESLNVYNELLLDYNIPIIIIMMMKLRQYTFIIHTLLRSFNIIREKEPDSLVHAR